MHDSRLVCLGLVQGMYVYVCGFVVCTYIELQWIYK